MYVWLVAKELGLPGNFTLYTISRPNLYTNEKEGNRQVLYLGWVFRLKDYVCEYVIEIKEQKTLYTYGKVYTGISGLSNAGKTTVS